MNEIAAFHFMRPWWLLCFIPVAVFMVSIWQSRIHMGRWENLCDTELLEALSLNHSSGGTRLWWYGLALLWSLTILALAGPTWSQLEVPIYRSEDAVVIAFDLSKSMDAEDIKPSRLERTKLKTLRLLKEREEGLFGLIVFSDHAFVTSPLTDDKKTISNYIPSLDPTLMPSQGSRPDRAILSAIELLQQAQLRSGNILLFSDGVADAAAANDAARRARRAGFRVSVLAVGSPRGGPIPKRQGGFVQNAQGELIIAKPDISALQEIAQLGGGEFQRIKQSDSDILQILNQFDIASLDTESDKKFSSEWQDAGYWLLLPLLLALAFSFRRGWLGCIGLWLPWLALPVLLTSEPSYAETGSFWQNTDRQAYKEFSRGNFEASSSLFEDSEWKAASLYRQNRYPEAAKILENAETASAHYNRGNALAQIGKYEEAIHAYNQALSLKPDHENAQFNKDLVEKLLHSPPPNQGQSKDNDDPQSGFQQQSDAAENSPQSEDAHSDANEDIEHDQSQNQALSDNNQNQDTENNPASSREDSTQEEYHHSQTKNAHSNTDTYQPTNETPSEAEQALQQWLRQVPDDPGGLLRRKFAVERQKKRYHSSHNEEPW